MKPERWAQIEQLYHAALEQAAETRVAFLDEACAGDETLRRQVAALLACDDQAASFIEASALQVAALALAADQPTETEISPTTSQLGAYQLLAPLGRGGMGEVHLALDPRLGRKVAIKLLPAEFTGLPERVRRFAQEARAASALNHPSIITIHEIGQADGAHYIVTEYVEGETLRRRLTNAPPLAPTEAIELAAQIAAALAAAHEAGITHRDIKPENVMVRPDGLVKVLDFGLAKLTESPAQAAPAPLAANNSTEAGIVMGTPRYMSPEQARGERVDARTDIFSLGVLLYEMIAGMAPFAGATASETVAAILRDEPPPLSAAPPSLAEIISRCLAKERAQRYQTAADLLADLRQLQRRIEFAAEAEREFGVAPVGDLKVVQAKPLNADAATSGLVGGARNSIAVLPFANLSAEAENEYFCDGLAEELLNALAKIEGLKVAARTSAFSFKGKHAGVSQIGRDLGVRTVLEGSVRKSRNRIRITVQLVNAADGYQLWSERYDRELKDIFDVQDEITLAVVAALKVQLLGAERAAVLKRYTDNTEAYELYLKGRFLLNQVNAASVKKAIGYFIEATQKEPRHAPAYARLAECYCRLPITSDAPAAEVWPKAKEAVREALEIDEGSDEAHTSLGWLKFWLEWDWEGAERAYRRAVALNGNNSYAYYGLAHLLSNLGRHREALDAIDQALKLDPFSFIAGALKGFFLYAAHRYEEALDQLHKTLELNPQLWVTQIQLGKCYERMGRYDEALIAFGKAREFGGTAETISLRGYTCAASGRRAEAEQALRDLQAIAKQDYVPPYNFALIHEGLGNRDEALRWLERAYKERDVRLVFLGTEPKWDSMRADPRFADLLRRVGFQNGVSGSTVREGFASRRQALPRGRTTATAPIAASRPRRTWLPIVLLSLLGVAAGLFAYRTFRPGAGQQIESLAILPFRNESGRNEVEYLADGMTESLINSLSQLPALSVKARSAVFRYKGREVEPQTAAADLSVQAILSGRVVHRGDDLTLYLSLVDGRNGNQLWGEQYQRKLTDLVALQSEITRDVSRKLRARLSGADEEKATKNYTESVEAYQLYLKGRYHLVKLTPPELQTAIAHFRQAIAIDPNYALAYVGLAEAYRVLAISAEIAPREVFPQAKLMAEKAIQIDDALAEAHSVLGGILFFYDWDWAAAEHQFKRALALNPRSPDTLELYALWLSFTARHDEALAAIKRARESDPLNLRINTLEARMLIYAGRLDEALAKTQQTLELDPNYWFAHLWASAAYTEKGMFAEAIASARQARQLWRAGSHAPAFEGYTLARWGKQAEARQVLTELLQSASPYNIALIYNGLGNREQTLAWLERGIQQRDPKMVTLKVDPKWRNLRADPRFQDLLRRVGFTL